MKRLILNQKIINDIILQKVERNGSITSSAKDALTSFKNLMTIIPNIQGAINYK